MNKNLFIIGNGFDLDLGRKTKYSDFANNAKYWKEYNYTQCPLKSFLEYKRETEKWFDIENALLEYTERIKKEEITKPQKYGSAANILYEERVDMRKRNVCNDEHFFDELHKALTFYLLEAQNEPINEKSVAASVFKQIFSAGCFDIYSFNYTNLEEVKKQLGLCQNIKCEQIHGKIIDNSIILGISEKESRQIPDGYDFLYKTTNPSYHSTKIIRDLEDAAEVVFFGMSFGEIDYVYFETFFNNIINNAFDVPKTITIFTKDINSRRGILNNLRRMNINATALYTHCSFEFFLTSDNGNEQKIQDFLRRIQSLPKSNKNRISI